MNGLLYVSIYDAEEHNFMLYKLADEQADELRAAKDKEKYVKNNLYCFFNDSCSLDISDKVSIFIRKTDGTKHSIEFL